MDEHAWCRDVQRDEAIRLAEDAAAAERTPLPDHRDLPAAVAELRERVARLESVRVVEASAPAASGAAGTEVVEFWGVRAKQSMAVPPGCASPRRVQSQPFQVFASEREAQAEADRCGGVVFAIPGSEPSAPPASGAAGTGWLTAEEREAVAFAAKKLYELSNRQYVNGDQDAARDTAREEGFLQFLLARSSPPEVVLPVSTIGRGERYDGDWVEGWIACRERCAAALAAAGVKVKEVGK